MQALFARRARLGLTWGELAEQTGVPKSTLHWWYRRLRDQGRNGKEPSRFVRVEVAEAPTAVDVVLRSGHRLVVPPGVDAEHLRRLVEVLESGC